MPKLTPIHVQELPRCNVLMRLTPGETRFLQGRIGQAVAQGKGVNLILWQVRMRACVIETDERGRELSINAFGDKDSHVVRAEQRGYEGGYTHVEMVLDLRNGLDALGRFLDAAEELA